MSELRQRLANELQQIPFCDTHEHFPKEETRLNGPVDLFFYLHYVSCDLTSAGQVAQLWEGESERLPLEEKWARFWEFWPYVEHTGYGQAFKIMAADLFGVEEINPEAFPDLNANAATFAKPGYYRTLLRERANIARSCRIVWSRQPTYCDLDHLFPVPVFDHFATVASRSDLRAIEQETNTRIHTLHDLCTALDAGFDRRQNEGMVGVKVFLACKRTLDFRQVSASEAEAVFHRVTQAHGDTPVGFSEAKPLQDYMVHQIIGQAVERGLPIQVHTGFQNDNGNFVTNSRPTHLVNLFMTYTRGKFNLLHGGWPYTQEFVSLAKAFPNVHADMAWTYIVGPRMAMRLLHELLESVPSNKILGFGGDYNFAEGAYAHARLARRVIRHVLAERIEDGTMSEGQALAVARRIMHDNAARMYGFPTLDRESGP